MIVRNEQAVIERCLASARPVIDAAVICDTGSTDETPAIIERYLAAHGIPGRVARHEWRHFGANRTAAVNEAEAFVASLGWPTARTWWLFLDADLELVVEPTFDRRAIADDAIALRQCAGSLSYWNTRLGRASLGWHAVGRTHEYYTAPDAAPPARIEALWIRDHADGGCRADKFARDIALLTEDLAEAPSDPRTLFYLAQSYLAVGHPLKALSFFRRRVAAGGWADEVWYAKLCVGRILAESDATDAALAVLEDVHAADPRRAEPLYELARLHRRLGHVADAVAYAERGRALPVPVDQALFVHTDVSEYGLDLELARAAAGTPDADRGFAACERLVRSRSRHIPAAVVDEARLITARYVGPIDGMTFRPLSPPLPSPYRPCNPSLIATPDGYLAICRAVNYEQRDARYWLPDTERVYRTENRLVGLDRAGSIVDTQPVVLDEPPIRTDLVQGLEDCRLVATSDALYFTCTTTDRHPRRRVHQSLCRLDRSGRVVDHRPLIGPFDDRPQKNWLPFADAAGRLLAIYGYDPLTVVQIARDSGAYRVVSETPAAVNTAAWRGSAGPLRWPPRGDGWLVVVHEVIHRPARLYVHRFAEYDADFALRRVSRPFVFAHLGIEFACGMTFAHDEDAVIVSFGIEDREAHLGRIRCARLDALLDG